MGVPPRVQISMTTRFGLRFELLQKMMGFEPKLIWFFFFLWHHPEVNTQMSFKNELGAGWLDGSSGERLCLCLSSFLKNRIGTQTPDTLRNPQGPESFPDNWFVWGPVVTSHSWALWAIEGQFIFPYHSLVLASLRQETWIVQQMIVDLGMHLISRGSLGNSWEIAPWPQREPLTSTGQHTHRLLLPSHFSGPHTLHIMASAACRPQTSSLPKPTAFDCNLCCMPLCHPNLLLQSTQREINMHL